MNGGYLQAVLFLLNRPEPIRQSSLLMVLASGMGDSAALLSGLQAMVAESSPPWSNRIRHLQSLLEQGQQLSEALTSVTGLLPEQSMIAIRIGEETGSLRQVLTDEAHRLMRSSESQNPVRVTLPAIIMWALGVGTVVTFLLSFMMIFIVPKMKKIFDDFGTDLPNVTESLIGVSDWFLSYWYVLALPLVTVVGYGGWFTVKALLTRLSTGHIPGSSLLPRLWTPLILRMLSITVATQRSVEAGMHCMLKEFRPGRAQQKLSAAKMRTAAGYDCWESLQMNGFLKEREVAFLAAANRTQHLDWALIHLARAIERRRDRWAQRLLSILHPIVVLSVGFAVLFVVVAMFLPLVKLINDLS
jgi:type IV pilus assembly protein PilC